LLALREGFNERATSLQSDCIVMQPTNLYGGKCREA